MIRVETIMPKPATSNRIENVSRSVRSTRESYNAYQRALMARARERMRRPIRSGSLSCRHWHGRSLGASQSRWRQVPPP